MSKPQPAALDYLDRLNGPLGKISDNQTIRIFNQFGELQRQFVAGIQHPAPVGKPFAFTESLKVITDGDFATRQTGRELSTGGYYHDIVIMP